MRGEHLDSDRGGDHTVLWPPLHFGALPYAGNLWHLLESTWAIWGCDTGLFSTEAPSNSGGKTDHPGTLLCRSVELTVVRGLYPRQWAVLLIFLKCFSYILQSTYICNFFPWSGDGAQDLVFTGQDLYLQATPAPLMFALYLFFF